VALSVSSGEVSVKRSSAMAVAARKYPAHIAATHKSRFLRHVLLRLLFIVLLASRLENFA
jgi:hypothetical protein